MKIKKNNISSRIIYGLIIGTLLGVLAKFLPAEWQPNLVVLAEQIKPVGGVFNKIIFMVVVPIVFCSLVSGISSLGGSKVGKIGIGYYKLSVIMVTAALIVAFSLSNFLQASGASNYKSLEVTAVSQIEKKPILQNLVDYVPSNPLEAMVNSSKGGLIPIMIFAAFVGFALIGRPKNNSLIKFNEEILAVSIRIVDFAMLIAPVSIAVLMFTTIFGTGFGLMLSLLSYIGVMVAAMLIQLIIVFSIVLLLAKKSPIKFFLNIKEVIATALATVSSAVTTPVAMRVAEEKLKLDPEISKVILTLGVTGNKTATTIFQIVAVTFLAKVAGVELGFDQYALLGFTAFISGIVTAGIPGAAIPVIAGLIATFGIPAEIIGLVVAVDRILDMGRTVVNVSGNLVIDEILAEKK